VVEADQSSARISVCSCWNVTGKKKKIGKFRSFCAFASQSYITVKSIVLFLDLLLDNAAMKMVKFEPELVGIKSFVVFRG